MSLKKNETKRKKLEEWEKQYRILWLSQDLLFFVLLLGMRLIGFAKESGRKQEINTKNFKIYDSFNFRIDSHICFVLVFSILHNKMDERIQRS